MKATSLIYTTFWLKALAEKCRLVICVETIVDSFLPCKKNHISATDVDPVQFVVGLLFLGQKLLNIQEATI